MKTIQMTIEETLLQQVDETVLAIKSTRSAFIREVLELALKQYRIRQLKQQGAAGYARIPSKPDEVAEWLPEQAWGEAWREVK